jgi:hypothetical protein
MQIPYTSIQTSQLLLIYNKENTNMQIFNRPKKREDLAFEILKILASKINRTNTNIEDYINYITADVKLAFKYADIFINISKQSKGDI